MSRISRLSSEEREDLVAYLDGELDEHDSREMERTLAESPVARNEVEMLTRTFELLDVLEPPPASGEFTQRTLETVKQTEAHTPLRDQPWYRTVRRGVLASAWVAGLAVAAALGFVATRHWVADEAELLIEDLPVVEDLRIYREVESIEFLKELHKRRYLYDDTQDE
ncbi:MAG: hypothetical protein KY476_14935 [Planctomycetes bacterium]|nr:hypothetical protein [Planctomycetota bacterium]